MIMYLATEHAATIRGNRDRIAQKIFERRPGRILKTCASSSYSLFAEANANNQAVMPRR
jgi:hypothetical protein